MPYFHALVHSFSVGSLNTILFNSYPFSVTDWRNFIQSWRSYLCQYRRRCEPHSLPLFSRWRNPVRKYCAGCMVCAAWLSLSVRYYCLYVFFKGLFCLDPVTRIHLIYFLSPCSHRYVSTGFFVKKEESRQFFQYTNFTIKLTWGLLSLKLEIFNTVNFRLGLGVLRGYKYL